MILCTSLQGREKGFLSRLKIKTCQRHVNYSVFLKVSLELRESHLLMSLHLRHAQSKRTDGSMCQMYAMYHFMHWLVVHLEHSD